MTVGNQIPVLNEKIVVLKWERMESIEEPKLENNEQQSENGDGDQDTLQGSKSAPELNLLPLPPSTRPKSLNNLTASMDCQNMYSVYSVTFWNENVNLKRQLNWG